MNLRLEDTHPPQYVKGEAHRIGDTHNYAVDEGTVIGIYVPVGEEDGEVIYRRVGEERKA